MTSERNDDELDEGGRDDDPGFLGGGGLAETIGDDAEEELDEHGENLRGADEDRL